MQSSLRAERGETIAKTEGAIRRIDEHSYEVRSQSGKRFYQVLSTEFGWACSCPDNQYRDIDCKHIFAVQISLALRRKVESSVVIQPINISQCVFCQSPNFKKFGIRRNKSGDIQRFVCSDCGKTFSINLGFEGMRASPQAITGAMQLYFTGESFRNVQKFLRLQGVNVSHVAVYGWIGKYVNLMERYLDKITPQVSDKWRTDELYLKVKGNPKYLFAMMDDETRFRIAKQVANHKGTSDVRPMFRRATERAGKKPKVLISDGAHNFGEACTKEWWTMKKETRTEHIRDIRLGGKIHNNKMERQNGEWRDREKVMRSLKREDSPVIGGMEIFHNFIRGHMGLPNEITPAEAAGIKVEGDNKWLTVIQNASNQPRLNRGNDQPTT